MAAKIKTLILSLFVMIVCACASKAMPPVLEPAPVPAKAVRQVKVIVLPGSLPFARNEIVHILNRTDEFCRQKGHIGVIQIKIFKHIVDNSPARRVSYMCLRK